MTDRGDWTWQLRHSIRGLRGLERALVLDDDERRGVAIARELGFPLRTTPYYLSLIDPRDPEDPIRRQVVPSAREAEAAAGDLDDPLGEVAHEVAPHLVRRYPDRALLLATDRCATHCRHCTRRRRVGRAGRRRLVDLEPAMLWIAEHREVREVLVSGGDPLVAPDRWVDALLRRIRRIRSVEVIRVGTRVPAVLPQRVTPSLGRLLRRHAPVFVATHFNHPRELSVEARRACETLVDAGVPVANQAVLLRGVNDCARVQIELSRALLRARVRPYYLMQCDPASGTGHLRAATRRGAAIVAAMRGRLSGLGIPTYVLDLPGGPGKVPIGPRYVESATETGLVARSPRGELARYEEEDRVERRCEACLCEPAEVEPGGLPGPPGDGGTTIR